MQLTAAVIGAGLMGKWHAHSISRLGANLAAIVEEDHQAGTALASRYKTLYIKDPEALFERDDVDVVHICTPPETHFDLATRALQSGFHVLVEKPMAPSATQTEELVEYARKHDKLICPILQFPFQDGMTKIRAELGKHPSPPIRVEFDVASAGGSGLTAAEQHALLIDILHHPMSVLYALWPNPQNQGGAWTTKSVQAGEMMTLGEHAGIPVLIKLSLHARPTRCEMIVQLDKGRMSQDFFHGFSILESWQASRLGKIAGPFLHSGKVGLAAAANLCRRTWRRQWAYPGLEILIRCCYSSIEAGNPISPIDEKDYIAVARTCDGLSSGLPATGA